MLKTSPQSEFSLCLPLRCTLIKATAQTSWTGTHLLRTSDDSSDDPLRASLAGAASLRPPENRGLRSLLLLPGASRRPPSSSSPRPASVAALRPKLNQLRRLGMPGGGVALGTISLPLGAAAWPSKRALEAAHSATAASDRPSVPPVPHRPWGYALNALKTC